MQPRTSIGKCAVWLGLSSPDLGSFLIHGVLYRTLFKRMPCFRKYIAFPLFILRAKESWSFRNFLSIACAWKKKIAWCGIKLAVQYDNRLNLNSTSPRSYWQFCHSSISAEQLALGERRRRCNAWCKSWKLSASLSPWATVNDHAMEHRYDVMSSL